MELWNVFRVYYLTYAEIDELPEPYRTKAINGHDREIIATNLSFIKAMKLVEDLGFGFSMHPA